MRRLTGGAAGRPWSTPGAGRGDLGEPGDPGARDRLETARTRLLVGAGVDRRGELPGRVARALAVAEAVGAPRIAAFDAAAAALDDDRRRRRAVSVAASQANVVAGGLAGLPVVAVGGLSVLLDVDLWRFYLRPTGVVVGAIGLALIAAGLLIVRRLAGRVGQRRRRLPAVTLGVIVGVVVGVVIALPAGLVAGGAVGCWRHRQGRPVMPLDAGDEIADLVATAIAGGLSAAAALRLVADRLPVHDRLLRRAALALDLGSASPSSPHSTLDTPPPLDRIVTIVATGTRWGGPIAPALRRVAEDVRASELARALAAAQRLPAQLAFPTALCLLPASVALVGAPLVAYGLSSAGAGL